MLKLWIGLTVGNYIWKGIEMFLTGEDYEFGEATKISFFQGAALFLASVFI